MRDPTQQPVVRRDSAAPLMASAFRSLPAKTKQLRWVLALNSPPSVCS